jgi:hypothetical protein
VGFEPTIPAFERAKTVHALARGHCDRQRCDYTTNKHLGNHVMLHSMKPSVIFTLHRQPYTWSCTRFKDKISHVPLCSHLSADTAVVTPSFYGGGGQFYPSMKMHLSFIYIRVVSKHKYIHPETNISVSISGPLSLIMKLQGYWCSRIKEE